MSRTARGGSLRRLMLCAMFAAVTCVLSPIAIPIGPIPISMGLVAVLLTAVCLPPLWSLISVSVYVALGICGLPVFGGAMGGAMVLFGPTGGYLWSYLPLSFSVSLLRRLGTRTPSKPSILFWRAFMACLCGLLICYFCGTLQYALLTRASMRVSLTACVLPFVPFDLVKALFAAALGTRLRRLLCRWEDLLR